MRYLILLLIFAAIGIGAVLWVESDRQETRAEVKHELDIAWRKKLLDAETKAGKALSAEKEKRDAEIKAIKSRLAGALSELRKRPDRSEQAIPAIGACPAIPACTGDRLARGDAEFLTRYAGRAALTQEALEEARNGFETCRQTLREVTGGYHGDQVNPEAGVPRP